MKVVFAIMCALFFAAWVAVRIIANINFDRHCEGYLKRAADANTVDLAIGDLEMAINYAEKNGLTSGFTSILYRTPSEDVGFWYQNMLASLNELRTIGPNASQLVKTNVLMKLRETLLDQGQSTSVTVPSGISVFPHNRMFAIWAIVSGILCCLFVLASSDRY